MQHTDALEVPGLRGVRPRKPRSEPRWRVAASPIPMLIFVRATGAIVAANDAAVRAYGATHEELLAAFISELVPPSDSVVDRLLRLNHPQTMWTGPLLQRRRDGSTFWAEVGMLEAGATGSATMAIVVKVQDPHPFGHRRHDARRGEAS